MSIVSRRFGVWLHGGLDRVVVLAAMRAIRREHSFEGEASPDARVPRLRSRQLVHRRRTPVGSQVQQTGTPSVE
jgi:hypothetical protein